MCVSATKEDDEMAYEIGELDHMSGDDSYFNYAKRVEDWEKVWLAVFDFHGSRVWKRRDGDNVRVLVMLSAEFSHELPPLSKMPRTLRGLHPKASRAERSVSISTTVGQLPANWFPKARHYHYAPLPRWVWVELEQS
jgi:hypothetical protein